MAKAIIFDLGNTLIEYFDIDCFSNVLKESIDNITNYLKINYNLNFDMEEINKRVECQNFEYKNFKVRYMEDRLIEIYNLYSIEEVKIDMLCYQFLKNIFKNSEIYNDTIDTLKELKYMKYKIGIISNLPWGSPSAPWKRELVKKGISQYIDSAVFCSDVGWRKPSPHIFRHALKTLKLSSNECIYIGDDPIVDIKGAEFLKIESILINRKRKNTDGKVMNNLTDLLLYLERKE